MKCNYKGDKMKNNQVSFWARNIQYKIEIWNSTEYVVPLSEQMYLYNPLENEYELLSDALNLGRNLTENDTGQKECVLDFVRKYGLLGIMTDITDSDLDSNEQVIIHENIFTESGIVSTSDFAKQFFPCDEVDILKPLEFTLGFKSRNSIYNKMFLNGWRCSEPIEWLIKYFKYLYNFMTADKNELENFNKPRLTYKIDAQREINLVCEYISLKAVIDFAFAKAVTDERKPLRYCKHCGKIFYAGDVRSEFCSPRCRNQFNVYKSRAKH